jgi:predicted AlkP superfamily phosphohydrolase/phosphomutase
MLLVVAWDGACFDIVDPLAGRGRLPAIARLLAEGARREVASTVPAITFPAWTTFATAASPALHGVTDFSVRSATGCVSSTRRIRALPALWNVVSERGGTAGVYALPATYPPDAFRGVMMCGFDTPLGAAKLGRRSHPAGFAGEVEARYGATGVGGPSQVRIDAAWHERALEQMLRTIEQRTRICVDLLRERSFDCFFVHYAESDTVAHQFWHLCDERSPASPAGAADDAIERVYEALDASLARLREAAGADADVMVISDHGSGGASDRAIFWNAWLAERGYLHFVERPLAARAAGAARRAVLRLVPPALQSTLLAAAPAAAARLESGTRLGGIDWSRTRVFSEELNYFPSLWLNLAAASPRGPSAPTKSSAW